MTEYVAKFTTVADVRDEVHRYLSYYVQFPLDEQDADDIAEEAADRWLNRHNLGHVIERQMIRLYEIAERVANRIARERGLGVVGDAK